MQALNGSLLNLRKSTFDLLDDIKKDRLVLRFSSADETWGCIGQDSHLVPRINSLFFKHIKLFQEARSFLDLRIKEKDSNPVYMAGWCWNKISYVTEKTLEAFTVARSEVNKKETYEAFDQVTAQVLAIDVFFKAKKIEWFLTVLEATESQDVIFQLAKQTQNQALEMLEELNNLETEKIVKKIGDAIDKKITGVPLFDPLSDIDLESINPLLNRLADERVITLEEKDFLEQQNLTGVIDSIRYQFHKIIEKNTKSEAMIKTLFKEEFPPQTILEKKETIPSQTESVFTERMEIRFKRLRTALVIFREAKRLHEEILSVVQELQLQTEEITKFITTQDLQLLQAHLKDLISQEEFSIPKLQEVYREFFSGISSFLMHRYKELDGTENRESTSIKESREAYEVAKEVRKDLKFFISHLKKIGSEFNYVRMELKNYTAIIRLLWLNIYLETVSNSQQQSKIQSWKIQLNTLLETLDEEFPSSRNLNCFEIENFCKIHEKTWKKVKQLKREINTRSS